MLYYFLSIKQKLSTAFYPQTDGQIERQISMMEVYLQVFINFEQNNWIQLLLIAKFANNNAKNISISYIPFKLNCEYYSYIFYKKDLDLQSKSKIAKKLFFKL